MCSHCVSPHFLMSPPVSEILLCFCLSIAPAPVAAELPAPTALPLEMCLDLGVGCQVHGLEEASESGDTHPPDSADMPATSCSVESFTHNQENKIYLLQ